VSAGSVAAPGRAAVVRGKRRGRISSGSGAWLFLVPSALIFLTFTALPAVFVLGISLYNWNMLNPAMSAFVGLGNYATLFTSAAFWQSLEVSLLYTLGTVPTGTLLALAIALLLMRRIPGRSLVRIAVFAPYVTPVVATSIVWIWILQPQFGFLNALLKMVHLPALGWLESPTWALPGVIIYSLWHSLGFTVVIFMAGLSAVATELLEAARTDGASRWREFWHITWPLITPTTLFVLVVSTIGSLQAFTQFFTMTGGGPIGSTTTTSFLVYENAFIFFQTGLASAAAVVLFVLIAAFTLAQLALSRRRAFYG
jgi:multiple sugar transport system permease protein